VEERDAAGADREYEQALVASDSTNQPDRNSGAWALKTQIMIPKVAKSKIELIGPKKLVKRRMNPVSQ
jgi:hypothetical protein